MKKYILGFIFCLVAFRLSAQERISLDQVPDYAGKNVAVLVEGEIAEVSTNFEKVTFINLGAKFPQQKLKLVLFDSRLANFKTLFFQNWQGKRIRVSGKISKDKRDRPQIILEDAEQIEFVED